MSITETAAGLRAGTWTIDPVHSEVGFSVRHLMVSKVRGTFNTFEGTIVVADDPLQSTVEVTIDASSLDTRDPNRDNHVKSADFLDVGTYPSITFRSTSVRLEGEDIKVDGELTAHGVTKPVTLTVEFNGAGPDPYGGQRAGFSAQTEINRNDFGVDLSMPLDGGGVVVGDRVKVTLEVEAILQQA
jgi:polyisoprenoid-binding protein YceI